MTSGNGIGTCAGRIAARARPLTFLFVLCVEGETGCGEPKPAGETCVPRGTTTAVLEVERPNLVANGSFETADTTDPSRPSNWTPQSWGTNDASFTYATDASTGHRAGSVEISTFSSGDAKWAFDAVPVVPGSSYVYGDRYKSSTATDVVGAYVQSDGTSIFQALGTAPASTDWATIAFAATPPPGTDRIIVYHLLAAVGALTIDDASLTLAQTPDMTRGVPNGSFEQGSDLDPDQPLAWRGEHWGDNDATFEYATSGPSGRHVVCTVSRHVNGDAKWYFDPVPVQPGTLYLFSDRYEATAASFLTARFTLADGSFEYTPLGSVPPRSAGLTLAKGTFIAPRGAVSATVFHGLSTTGTLRLDDASLVALPGTTEANGVPNGDLEQEANPNADVPALFSPNTWGANTASFSYLNEGHSGARSVRVDVTDFTSGAASWFYEPQPVIGGQAYRVSDYYRSNVDTEVVAEVSLSDGTITFVRLPVAYRSSSWAPYSAKLYLPSNAATVTVHHRLTRVGYLETDDYSLTRTTTLPFRRGLVSLTFDDGWRSIHDEALPLLRKHGATSTQYVVTGQIGSANRMTLSQIEDFHRRGHEVAAHTVTHPDLTTLARADLEREVRDSKTLLDRRFCAPTTSFASPFGIYDEASIQAIAPVYRSHRTTDVGYNTKDDFDVHRLKAQNIRSTTTTSEVAEWVARAARDRSYLIIVYHDVVEPAGSEFSTTPANLDAQLTAIQASGLPISTVSDAVDELLSQL